MNIDNLKKAREKIKLTQSQAAAALSISDGTYKNYEQGKREPNNEMLIKIANLFHVTTDYLLGRNTDEPETVDVLANEFNMTALEQKILDNYLALPKDMRDSLMDFLHTAVEEVQNESDN